MVIRVPGVEVKYVNLNDEVIHRILWGMDSVSSTRKVLSEAKMHLIECYKVKPLKIEFDPNTDADFASYIEHYVTKTLKEE